MSDTLTLEEKQEQAKALIAEVKKAAAKGGGDDGQDYEAHRRKFEQAQALMTEVKAEKNEGERKELLTLLEAFEKQTATPPAGSEDDGIVTSAKSRLAEIDERKRKADEINGERVDPDRSGAGGDSTGRHRLPNLRSSLPSHSPNFARRERAPATLGPTAWGST